jgi:hypothetical protein
MALAGCDVMNIDVYDCPAPDKGHQDAKGQPDPCHRNDLAASDAGLPGDAGETCAGVCLPGFPNIWVGPELVWMGDEADAPPCPARASVEGFTARRPPAAPPCAATCTCAPPSGACALPATLTAAAASCADNGPGVAHTSFDPPASWTGACAATNAIPAGKLCGGVPCVQSVTIAPLTVSESSCLPIETPNISPPPWGTFARACTNAGSPPRCSTADALCVPAAPGPEFKQCIATIGNPAFWNCPATYPEKSVFYSDFVDNRSCSPCSCGAAEGGTCVGSIGLFTDPACGAPLIGPTIAIDAVGPKCLDVPQGSALGSKSASEPTYKPGSCPITGGEKGQIDANLTWVICCQGTP